MMQGKSERVYCFICCSVYNDIGFTSRSGLLSQLGCVGIIARSPGSVVACRGISSDNAREPGA